MEQLQQKDLCLGSYPDRRRFLQIAIGAGTTSVIGISKTQRVRAAEGEAVWRFETDGYVDSSPTVLNGRVYVGSESLYALNAGTGETEWSIGGSVSSSATVVDGTVFFGSFDQNLYAVDTGTGTEEWRFETESRVNSSPTVMDGTVFFGGGNSVFALDAATGEEEWHFEIGDRIFSSPTLVEGTLFVGSWDNNVYALDAKTGEKEWEFETNGSIGWSSPTVVDGLVFIGSRDRYVYGLDARTGEEEWHFETGDWVSSSPTVIDGIVFVGSSDNNVYALTAETGEEEWRFETGDSVSSSPTVAEGVVFVGSDDKNVYALDAATGEEEWHFETGGSVFSSPIVVGGTVFIGSRDNYVYALETNVEGSSEGSRVLLGALGHHSERGGIDQLDSRATSTASGGTTVTETPVTAADETGQIGIQNRRDILPVALGLLGLGGAGAWWITRRGDSDGQSSSGEAIPTETPTGPPAESTLRAVVTGSLDEGDELREKADDYYNAGKYDRALEAYAEAHDAYKDALETASQGDANRIDTGKIKRRLTAVEEAQREIYRDQLQDRIASVRSDLNRADTLANDGEIKEAKQRLGDLANRLESAEESAAQYGFENLQEKIATLEELRQDRLTDVTERLKSRPIPEKIPRSPDVSVDYDALTDEQHIGSGGNAHVTRATLSTPEGDVILAIKKPKIPGGESLHIDEVEQLLEEAGTWDKLDDHDHIVGVVDWGSEPLPWIAMEYMDGGHLRKRTGKLDIPQALWIAIAVTKGVRHAHRRGVAHLDLKPQNVLFRTVAEAWDVPKVADWGLSKRLLESPKSVKGLTPEYAAPEQFEEGDRLADDITDVYQLGAVFYELFTGRPPFQGQSFEIMNKIKNTPPSPPSEIANVPEAIDDILLTALSKDKDDRYESVLLMRNDLQALYNNW